MVQLAPYSLVDPVVLGRTLKGARAEAGCTAAQASSEMQRRYGVSISAAALGRYERGETQITLEVFLALMLTLKTNDPMTRILPAMRSAEARNEWKMLNAS
jgi:transcriptional regulator with XRE-family HTH domain